MKYTTNPRDTLRSNRQPDAINDAIAGTIQRALTAAGLPMATGPMARANATIRRALAAAGLAADAAETREPRSDASPFDSPRTERSGAGDLSRGLARAKAGQFLSRSYSNAAGTLAYKLYVPECRTGEPMPLIVMLHGCTQDPDDFAAGTRMNALADKEGCLVVYPAQAAGANGAKCWNWFKPTHQVADRGEPSLIAGITREVASSYAVDRNRIFVAGLSAGAAMAVVLGATYPDLFAAVGAHSGLPFGAAHDVPSAFAAMRGGAEFRSRSGASDRGLRPREAAICATPTIVFHGDEDTTVNATNGSTIVSHAIAVAELKGPLTKTVQPRKFLNGREYTATIYRDSTRRSHVEEWIVHGAAHAWSGGSSAGSYTDVTGPDASAEMLRFFLAQSSR